MVSNLLFVSVFSTGFFMLLLSSSFLWMWLSMELVSLSVAIYILVNSSVADMSGKKGTLVLKYLMVQFIAGSMTLSSSLLSDSWWELMLIVALCLKLSLVPLHSWVVDLFSSISLMDCMVLGVISKIGPLLMLSHWLPSDWAFSVGALSIVSSSFMSIMYSDLRHIMSCSSIISTGWLSISAGLSSTTLLLCFIFYSVSNLVMFWFLEEMGVYSLSDSMTGIVASSKMKMLVSLILMTNLSLPLFLFFLVKLLVIVETKWYFLLLITLILSSVSIIWYSRVINTIWSYEGTATLSWSSHHVSPFLLVSYISSGISGLMVMIYLI